MITQTEAEKFLGKYVEITWPDTREEGGLGSMLGVVVEVDETAVSVDYGYAADLRRTTSIREVVPKDGTIPEKVYQEHLRFRAAEEKYLDHCVACPACTRLPVMLQDSKCVEGLRLHNEWLPGLPA